jgi:hypothetical protein
MMNAQRAYDESKYKSDRIRKVGETRTSIQQRYYSN